MGVSESAEIAGEGEKADEKQGQDTNVAADATGAPEETSGSMVGSPSKVNAGAAEQEQATESAGAVFLFVFVFSMLM